MYEVKTNGAGRLADRTRAERGVSSMSTSYTRISTDGPNGSGKTCTNAQLAVGLALEYGDGADVHVFDSSNRWRTWKQKIFDVEKIPLRIYYGESIAVLQKAAEAAMRGPCSVFVADDLTVPWMEGNKSFAYETGNLSFERRQQLLNEWRQYVQVFRHGPFHALACGRMGYVWETVEDEYGDEKLHQGDPKFNAGGGENFGYDADLELTMRRKTRKLLGFIRGKLTMEHIVDVRKDAHSVLNARQFVYQDWTGPYRPGMYKTVLDDFRPHIEFVRRLDSPIFDDTSSKRLIISGKTEWAKDQATRRGHLEELNNLLNDCFPGGEKRSKIDAMLRNLTLEYLNGFSSWSRMEEETKTVHLERNVLIAKQMRARIRDGERINDQNALSALLHIATEDVLHPGHGLTLLQVLAERSIPKNGKGPQPIVTAAEAERADEIAGD